MAFETIAFDSASTETANASTSITKAHTTSGSNRLLFCAIRLRDSSGDAVTGGTYNGTALTRLATNANTNHRNYLYYLIAPDTGTHDLVMSAGASVNFEIVVATYTGVSQTSFPDDSANSLNNSTNTISDTVTTTIDNAWVVGFGTHPSAPPTVGEGGMTSRGSIFGVNLADSGPVATAGVETHSYDGLSSSQMAIFMAAIAPKLIDNPTNPMFFRSGFTTG